MIFVSIVAKRGLFINFFRRGTAYQITFSIYYVYSKSHENEVFHTSLICLSMGVILAKNWPLPISMLFWLFLKSSSDGYINIYRLANIIMSNLNYLPKVTNGIYLWRSQSRPNSLNELVWGFLNCHNTFIIFE